MIWDACVKTQNIPPAIQQLQIWSGLFLFLCVTLLEMCYKRFNRHDQSMLTFIPKTILALLVSPTDWHLYSFCMDLWQKHGLLCTTICVITAEQLLKGIMCLLVTSISTLVSSSVLLFLFTLLEMFTTKWTESIFFVYVYFLIVN